MTVYRKLPWWDLRRGAKLRGPKTFHRDGNHATRNAKALVPLGEVTSQLRRETKQKPHALAMRARAGLVQRAETERPTTRTTARPTTLVPLLCVLCAVPTSPQERTMSSVPFHPTPDECSESQKTRRDQEARLRRRLPGESPGATRRDALVIG